MYEACIFPGECLWFLLSECVSLKVAVEVVFRSVFVTKDTDSIKIRSQPVDLAILRFEHGVDLVEVCTVVGQTGDFVLPADFTL